MMKKEVGIFVALVLVIAIAAGIALSGCRSSQGSATSLSAAQKADVVAAYKLDVCTGWPGKDPEEVYKMLPIVWFDENGGKRDEGVYRYFGTYGDCIVMLRYGDGIGATFEPLELPLPLRGLPRPVDYPVECDIVLYNTNLNYPTFSGLRAPLSVLSSLIHNKVIWLTDEQLEQLTSDLESWLAEGNY